jgi:copper chaperone NosL
MFKVDRRLARHRSLPAALIAIWLSACGPSPQPPALAPVELDQGKTCALDGMLLIDFPGPKAQIHYQGSAAPDFFCDTIEMFSIYLNPEQARPVRALYVQDMGSTDWEQPQDHWIDAKTAWYVLGSSRRGSMGPTLASFARAQDAKQFAAAFGGKVLAFAEITADQVNIDGGVLHDQRM